MFSALRLNSVIYILDKTNEPELRKGQVLSVTAPKPVYGQPMNMVVDVEINVNGSRELFKDLPASLSVANNGNLVISESKEGMSMEIENMLATSKQIVESVNYHTRAIEVYDLMLQSLNPLFAKEREHETKINLLEDKVTGIENSLFDIKAMLSKALNH